MDRLEMFSTMDMKFIDTPYQFCFDSYDDRLRAGGIWFEHIMEPRLPH
jgi:hypothetical protein